jgi:ubiquinone/menaquinone biosynthesis C-methylase UbiE
MKIYDFKIDENIAIHFEKYMKRYPQYYQHIANIVKKNITDNIKKPIILDLGIGPGLLSKEINKVLPDAYIIGVDPSEEMLKLSKKNAFVETKVGIAESIPMENSSVDVIVCRFNLSYWQDFKKGFSEVNRVLKPGGKFIIEELNKNFSYLKLFVIRLLMIFKGSGFDIARYHYDAYKTACSIDCVKKLFKDTNFKIVYSEGEKKDWRYIFVAKKIDT